jgi:hypothetical protein
MVLYFRLSKRKQSEKDPVSLRSKKNFYAKPAHPSLGGANFIPSQFKSILINSFTALILQLPCQQILYFKYWMRYPEEQEYNLVC